MEATGGYSRRSINRGQQLLKTKAKSLLSSHKSAGDNSTATVTLHRTSEKAEQFSTSDII